LNKNAQDRLRLETLHEIVDELDYYRLLQLNQNCEQQEISVAFRQMSVQFHPDKSPHMDLTDKSTYIFTSINEAFRVLKSPESRMSYDHQLAQGQIRIDDTVLQSDGVKSRSNDPSQAATTDNSKKYWTLGLQDYETGNFDSAILNIRFALQFEPKNEVFQEWLEKAQEAAKKAPKKESNPYKLRL